MGLRPSLRHGCPCSAVLALGIAACGPVEVNFPGDPAQPPPAVYVPPDEAVLVSARADASGVRACTNPSDRERLGPFEARVSPAPAASVSYLWSGGVLAGDLDGDGALDLIEPLEDGARLFRGRADGRMADWDERLAGFDLTFGSGGSLADVDGDGDLDVLIVRYDAPAVLLRNDGGGHFVDATAAANIGAVGPTTSSAWGDLEGDGDLDLFVGSYGYLDDADRSGQSYLFENLGDGVFVDRSWRLPPAVHEGYTRVGGFHDLDDDGLPELYVVNDVGSVVPNVLLRNVGGTLVLDDNASGLDLPMSGGGLGVGNVNGDLQPDFLIPQWDEISLMLSTPDGRWLDWAGALGLKTDPIRGQRVGWGAELADLDNDGDLDGVVAYGRFEVDIPYWENPEIQPDALFLQQDDGTFVDEAPEWGVDDGGAQRGFVVADFDGDGWLDLAKRDLEGPSLLYVSRCGRAHFLTVELRDERLQNPFAVGARVTVTTPDGQVRSRWVTAGGTGFGTGGPPVLHFGLGDADSIDQIDVRWPDGARSRLGFGLEADQNVVLTRD